MEEVQQAQRVAHHAGNLRLAGRDQVVQARPETLSKARETGRGNMLKGEGQGRWIGVKPVYVSEQQHRDGT